MSEETTENVVTSSDVAKKTPTSFRDLNKTQLVEAARVFGTQDEGNVTELRADLEENGVTWEMYSKQFKLDGHENIPEPPVVEPRQIQEEDLIDGKEVEEVEEIVTANPETFQANKYLVKFVGENPYFEFGRFRFTQEKPYGIMNANEAQRALIGEPTKFRQAYPKELEEFYS